MSPRSKFVFSTILLSALISIQSCRTTKNASIKDNGKSPADPRQPSIVIWQTDDGFVHYGECPVGSAAINRSCSGIVEKFLAMPVSDFKDDMIAAITELRPAGTVLPVDPEVTELQEKIKRLQDKITAGVNPQTEANFKVQIEQFQKQLANPKYKLLPDENSKLEKFMTNLQNGKDITYDEGEADYDLVSHPFTGPNSKAVANKCGAGGKPYAGVCWYLAQVNDSCTTTCGKVKGTTAPETVTFAGSGGSLKNCTDVGNQFGARPGQDFGGGPVGCIIASAQAYRSTNDTTTDDAVSPAYNRICACK